MAHNNHDKDIEYIGDSRVRAGTLPNIPRDFSEYPGKTEPFFPNFLLKEWMVAVVVLVGFLILLVEHPAPLGPSAADPTNPSGFIPVPDWYFLFLYQLLKYDFVAGPFVVIGILVIPGLAFGALLLAPFLDTGKERKPSKRPIAVGLMLVSLACVIFLTWAAVDEHHHALELKGPAPVVQPPAHDTSDLPDIVDPESEGADVYAASSCISCHGTELEGGVGPALKGVGNKYSLDQILDIINNGKGDNMPAGMFQGTEEEKKTLAEWLLTQK